jgi:hypothetical protein
MTTIHKFPFEIADDVTIKMPMLAEIVRVGTSGGKACMWAIVDTAKPMRGREFKIRGTGHPIDFKGDYIGSIAMPPFVRHVFGVR